MYQPIGPINAGQQIILCSIINQRPYVAVYDTDQNVIVMLPILSPETPTVSYNLAVTESDIIKFTATGTQDKLALSFPYGIVGGSGNLLAPTATNSSTISVSSGYTLPQSPGLLLSGIMYNFRINGNQAIIYAQLPPETTDYSTVNAMLIPISLTVYNKSTGCNSPSNTALNAMKTFFCSWCTNSSVGCGSLCAQYNGNSFTNSTDCNNNIAYMYCMSGQTCGSCYGTCSSGTCRYNSTNNMFSCSGSPSPNPSPNPSPITPNTMPLSNITPSDQNGPFYTSTWFLIVVAVIIIIILGIIVYRYSRPTVPIVQPMQYNQMQPMQYNQMQPMQYNQMQQIM